MRVVTYFLQEEQVQEEQVQEEQEVMAVQFTLTESRIMAILQDGMGHTIAELHQCLYDDMGVEANVKQHIYNLRKKLNNTSRDIIHELSRRVPGKYRLVRRVQSVRDE